MPDIVAVLTAVAYASICGRLLTYRRPSGGRYKPFVSVCAWLLIVGTGGQAIRIFIEHDRGGEPLQLLSLAVLAISVFAARGNLARLLRFG